MSYHETVRDVYRKAADQPDAALCCIPMSPQFFPELVIPDSMHAMNYGCGSTVHPRDMRPDQRVLYVGVGGGLEALQFAYFTRRPIGVLAVDPVPEMREAARRNLEEAARLNPWFDPGFVEILDGDARELPVADDSIDIAAQNCLFNIFRTAGLDEVTGEATGDLERSLAEMHRVLKPGGRLVMSDPVTPRPLPAHLQEDDLLRAQCITGCLTYEDYIAQIVAAGFGAAEIRSRRPYRALSRVRAGLDEHLVLDTLELAAVKTPVPVDGACIFTGRTAIYIGDQPQFDDGKGHILRHGIPEPVCDKTANALANLERDDLIVTASTWHHAGGGCC